jgi:hypothetical protein
MPWITDDDSMVMREGNVITLITCVDSMVSSRMMPR